MNLKRTFLPALALAAAGFGLPAAWLALALRILRVQPLQWQLLNAN